MNQRDMYLIDITMKTIIIINIKIHSSQKNIQLTINYFNILKIIQLRGRAKICKLYFVNENTNNL